MYVHGSVSRVGGSLNARDGLQTYTYRYARAGTTGSLVDTLVTVDNDRPFHSRFINTQELAHVRQSAS